MKQILTEEQVKAMDEMLTTSSQSLKEALTQDPMFGLSPNTTTDPSPEIKMEASNPNETQEVSELSYDIIKQWEGYREEAYQDVAGIWTIGYGHTKNVHPGDICTKDEANKYLQEDLWWCHQALSVIEVPLTINQKEALISFIYNVGPSAFLKSTLLKKLNQSDYFGAANEFLRWNKAGGRVIQGLINRREAEKELFLKDFPNGI